MTIPGASRGSASRKDLRASVPPVDAPTTTTRSVVWIMARELGFSITASAVSFGSTFIKPLFFLARPRRASAAAFTVSQMMTFDSSRYCLTPIRGFSMISTAPYSSAFMAVSEFFSVRLEHMTTGMGLWVMIL